MPVRYESRHMASLGVAVPGYFTALLRYFDLTGRSTRSEYWFFMFGYAVLTLVSFGAEVWCMLNLPGYSFGPIVLTVVFFHFVPSITVSLRRLHDIGKSGAWYLLTFIPFGALVLLIWACFDSEEGSNAWGHNPKDERWERLGERDRQRRLAMQRSAAPPDRATAMIAKMNARQTRTFGRFSS